MHERKERIFHGESLGKFICVRWGIRGWTDRTQRPELDGPGCWRDARVRHRQIYLCDTMDDKANSQLNLKAGRTSRNNPPLPFDVSFNHPISFSLAGLLFPFHHASAMFPSRDDPTGPFRLFLRTRLLQRAALMFRRGPSSGAGSRSSSFSASVAERITRLYTLTSNFLAKSLRR